MAAGPFACSHGGCAAAARAQHPPDSRARHAPHDANPLRQVTQLPRGGRVVPTPVATWAEAAPYIRTALLVDGASGPVGADETVALPSGSRFRLQVSNGEAAEVEVHAVNAHGTASAGPLWRGVIGAHHTAQTPRLRRAGSTGVKTLRVLRRSLSSGVTTEQQVQVLHL